MISKAIYESQIEAGVRACLVFLSGNAAGPVINAKYLTPMVMAIWNAFERTKRKSSARIPEGVASLKAAREAKRNGKRT